MIGWNSTRRSDTVRKGSQYRRAAHLNVTHRRRQQFYALPSKHWKLLAEQPYGILDTLEQVDDGIDANAEVAEAILEAGLCSLGLDASSDESEQDTSEKSRQWKGTATPADLDKARSTVRQMYREWSEAGAGERRASFGPVMNAIDQAFAEIADKSTIKILNPGAGLGRFVFDLCLKGYCVEGNEISYHQLLASNFILNITSTANQFSLYPWAFDFSNVVSRRDQLAKVSVPDRHPASELAVADAALDAQGQEITRLQAVERLSMSAADFVLLYSDENHREKYHCVATVFFVDTAPNVIRYIETIHHCLLDGGLWVNNGPLLWHFGEERGMKTPATDRSPSTSRTGATASEEDMGIGEPGSVELSGEEILHLVQRLGFHIEDQKMLNGNEEQGGQREGYTQNPNSMLQHTYGTMYWLARKCSNHT